MKVSPSRLYGLSMWIAHGLQKQSRKRLGCPYKMVCSSSSGTVSLKPDPDPFFATEGANVSHAGHLFQRVLQQDWFGTSRYRQGRASQIYGMPARLRPS